ncbi:MAG: ABC transporter transmembrane domain-containing protein, partial [candidate division Zixibacteria bacterium]|nr:ABC transporter transmembrane domain-containing protein [candidate division Zixibacteria bacterium]
MTSDFYENEKITEKEKQIGTKEAFLNLLPYLKEHSKRLFIALILLSGGTFLSLVWPILLKNGIDGPLKEKDFNGLLIVAGVIGLIQIVTIVIQYFMRIKLEIIGQDIMLKLKQKLFDHILSLDIS